MSILSGELSTKDIKTQGIYKLNHLLNIVLSTGIPSELILVGDNFESDPVIYLTFAKILQENIDPWTYWNKLSKTRPFKVTRVQNAKLLYKFHQLKSMLNRFHTTQSMNRIKIKIFIRKKNPDDVIHIPPELSSHGHIIEGFTSSEILETQRPISIN